MPLGLEILPTYNSRFGFIDGGTHFDLQISLWQTLVKYEIRDRGWYKWEAMYLF